MYAMYITANGDYGEATPETYDTVEWKSIQPVFHWTPAMFEEFDDTPNSERHALAEHFLIGVHYINDNDECITCHLSSSDVHTQIVKPEFESLKLELEEE